MGTKWTRLLLKAQRYKKVALFGAGALIVSVCLVATGLLFVISNSNWTSPRLSEDTQSITTAVNSMLPPSDNTAGVIGKTMLAGASYYIQMTMQQSELSQHAAALSCFESLGGPSSHEVLDAVKLKLKSPEASASLENLKSMLQTSSGSGTKNQGACIQWIFNS